MMLTQLKWRFTLTVSAAALFAALLSGCEAGEDEQAALSVVSSGTALLEKGEIAKALRLTTSDFLAQPGRLDRRTVLSRMAAFYRLHGEIVILHPTPEVEILDSGKAALVSAPFVAAERGVDRKALDDLADDTEAWEALASQFTTVEHAEVSLVKQGDRWLVSSVRF